MLTGRYHAGAWMPLGEYRNRAGDAGPIFFSALWRSLTSGQARDMSHVWNRSLSLRPAGPARHSPLRIGQPILVRYRFHKDRVDVLADQFLVRIGDLPVFVFAVLGSFLRQISLLHHVAKQL